MSDSFYVIGNSSAHFGKLPDKLGIYIIVTFSENH